VVPENREGAQAAASFDLPVADHGVINAIVSIAAGTAALRLEAGLGTAEAWTVSSFRLETVGLARSLLAPTVRRLRRIGLRPRELRRQFTRGWQMFRTSGPYALVRSLTTAESGGGQNYGYHDWAARYDTLSEIDRNDIRARIDKLSLRPRISVVMPVFETEERWLRRAIDSVREQLYPDWELCIADDASKAQHIRRVLAEYAAADPRIKVTFRERNGHVSAASNTALALATGDFVALLDHDDELAPHALYCVAEDVAAHPNATIIYSDEDKLDPEGRRNDPYFKCDWNPDLFLSHNMIGHLGVYRRDIVMAVGGFREGYEGSQDYDLALRVLDHPSCAGIRHIPHVLYHWRMKPGSIGDKSHAADAALCAIRDHLTRRGVVADVIPAPGYPAFNRVRYQTPPVPPLVSIIVPTRDRAKLLRRCVESVLTKTDYRRFEVIIVDNGSSEKQTAGCFELLGRDPRVRIIRHDMAFNFSALNNRAAKQAAGEVLVLLNNDIEVIAEGWLTELVAQALRPEVGPVGAMLYYPDNTIQHAGILLGVGGIANHAHRHLARGAPGYFGRAALAQSFSAVTGACLAIRRDKYEALGGLDESLAVAFNDVDLCLRAAAHGWRTMWTPYAELYHHESASRGPDVGPDAAVRLEHESQIMRQRWGDLLQADPCYSRNLTAEREDFSLGFPPRVCKPWAR
jgi:GT2 family glycosyltransferase